MGTTLLLALASALTLQDHSNASANDTSVSVNVMRTMRVTPDRASMYVIVESVGETPTVALERLTPRMNVVRDTLRRFATRGSVANGLPFHVGPVNQQSGYPPPTPATSYAARGIFRVSVGIGDLAGVQAAAYSAGAANVTGYSYESLAPDSIWRLNLTEAAEEARAAAMTLARTQGKRLGALIDMNAGKQAMFVGPPQVNLDSRYQASGGAPEVAVTATVSVRYRLISQ